MGVSQFNYLSLRHIHYSTSSTNGIFLNKDLPIRFKGTERKVCVCADRERSSINQFSPHMDTMAGAEPERSEESGAPSRSSVGP